MNDVSRWEKEAPPGQKAEHPTEIPSRGWWAVLKRVKNEISEDNLSMVAASVAFYVLLALFPALAAIVAIYGLVADPVQIEQQFQTMGQVLPGQAQQILQNQLRDLASQSGAALGLGAIFGILLSLWSASAGVKALMYAMNITYEEDEKRGFLGYYGTALLLTLSLVIGFILAVALVIALPALLGALDLPPLLRAGLGLLRWILLGGLVIFALAVLYRYGPSRDEPQWRWVSSGAVVATVLWLIASGLFSWYVANFGSYNETYGSVGAIVILLMWLWLSVFVVLLGSELNAELEHQTARDTTVGKSEPMGKRGAEAADTTRRDS